MGLGVGGDGRVLRPINIGRHLFGVYQGLDRTNWITMVFLKFGPLTSI